MTKMCILLYEQKENAAFEYKVNDGVNKDPSSHHGQGCPKNRKISTKIKK